MWATFFQEKTRTELQLQLPDPPLTNPDAPRFRPVPFASLPTPDLTLDHVSHVAKSKPLTPAFDYTVEHSAYLYDILIR